MSKVTVDIHGDCITHEVPHTYEEAHGLLQATQGQPIKVKGLGNATWLKVDAVGFPCIIFKNTVLVLWQVNGKMIIEGAIPYTPGKHILVQKLQKIGPSWAFRPPFPHEPQYWHIKTNQEFNPLHGSVGVNPSITPETSVLGQCAMPVDAIKTASVPHTYAGALDLMNCVNHKPLKLASVGYDTWIQPLVKNLDNTAGCIVMYKDKPVFAWGSEMIVLLFTGFVKPDDVVQASLNPYVKKVKALIPDVDIEVKNGGWEVKLLGQTKHFGMFQGAQYIGICTDTTGAVAQIANKHTTQGAIAVIQKLLVTASNTAPKPEQDSTSAEIAKHLKGTKVKVGNLSGAFSGFKPHQPHHPPLLKPKKQTVKKVKAEIPPEAIQNVFDTVFVPIFNLVKPRADQETRAFTLTKIAVHWAAQAQTGNLYVKCPYCLTHDSRFHGKTLGEYIGFKHWLWHGENKCWCGQTLHRARKHNFVPPVGGGLHENAVGLVKYFIAHGGLS